MILTPSPGASARLFATGATVGTLVDSLHNQSLLRYDVAPILIGSETATITESTSSYLFTSSWAVPPLLGVAYVVLGGVLPRLASAVLSSLTTTTATTTIIDDDEIVDISLRSKALLAVASTAAIIRLSELLQTTDPEGPLNLVVMASAACLQWALLDGTPAALVVGALAGVFGPLAELPFVYSGFWHYVPSAADYLPLHDLAAGTRFESLALSSITGPCYFAVTMDAIALGRWFDDDDASRTLVKVR